MLIVLDVRRKCSTRGYAKLFTNLFYSFTLFNTGALLAINDKNQPKTSFDSKHKF